jgi:hypothetical protein
LVKGIAVFDQTYAKFLLHRQDQHLAHNHGYFGVSKVSKLGFPRFTIQNLFRLL